MALDRENMSELDEEDLFLLFFFFILPFISSSRMSATRATMMATKMRSWRRLSCHSVVS